MLLRRMFKHVKGQNWLAVAIDFGIVVFGVFAGIQLGNWNTARQDRAEEAAFLSELHGELSTGASVYRDKLAARLAVQEAMGSALELLSGETPPRTLTDEECMAIGGSFIFSLGNAALPSLDRLQANNRVGIIRDEELAEAIARLSQVLKTMRERTDLLPKPVVLSDRYPEAVQVIAYIRPAPEQVDGTEVTVHYACDLEAMRAAPGFFSATSINFDLYDGFLRDVVQPYSAAFEKLHEVLDQELGTEHERPAGRTP
ncbi:hypothetical protein [Parvularcula lutaonensis]|uniref:Uncharacterized protein n=1 Tax=Parvularcula lutaonensis TaxID=491923 RepID=A0ABV7MFY2_9PROT|nr:hypothetical protein [Parvularcula lutaonensis]GGY55283.1 hypothetical protein GCM10007148_26440 [Parvularcula lutaonensis]